MLAYAGLFCKLDQIFAPLLLLDLVGPLQQRFQIAVFQNQLRRGLDADPGNAGHIIGRIACQCLHIDNLVRRHAELGLHLGKAEFLQLHRVQHGNAVIDQLHQVFVGRDDSDLGALGPRLFGVGGDQVVGLIALQLDAGQVEGADGLADQVELRDQFFRRRRAVRLIFRIDVRAERLAAGVENDGDVVGIGVLQQLHQHGAEAVDGVDRRAIGPRHRRQGMEGTEDKAGAID